MHVVEFIINTPALNFRLTVCSTDMWEGGGFQHPSLKLKKNICNQRNNGCF